MSDSKWPPNPNWQKQKHSLLPFTFFEGIHVMIWKEHGKDNLKSFNVLEKGAIEIFPYYLHNSFWSIHLTEKCINLSQGW